VGEPNVLAALGLQTTPNELGAVQAGGLRKAENCVMMGPGLIGPRRGQASVGYAPSNGQPQALGLFGNTLVANTVDFAGDYSLEYDSGSAFVAYEGNYAPPAPETLRMKFSYVQKCMYATTSRGIVRVDVKENAPVLSGGPRTWQIYSAGLNPVTVGFLPPGSSVAYRVVFGVKDVNGVVHLGVPSGRVVVDNLDSEDNYDGANKNVALTIAVPNSMFNQAGADAAAALLKGKAFWQLYRTRVATSYTTQQDGTVVYVPPDDEMYLCQEAYFTTADFFETGGLLNVIDTTVDDFLGDALYTNGIRDQGALQQNDAPPLSYDIAAFDQRQFYANTRRYPQLLLQIVGVGEGQNGYTGIRLGDQITVLGNTYKADVSYNPLTNSFELFTTDLDAAVNINRTAQSLVNLINATNSGYAQLIYTLDGAGNPIPGRILFQSYDLDAEVWQAKLTTRQFNISPGDMVRIGTDVLVATDDPHGLAVDDVIYLNAATPDLLFPVGPKIVTAIGPSIYEFTYSEGGTAGANTHAYTERRLTPEPQFAWSPPPPPTVFSVAVSELVRTSNVVACTTSVAHDLSPGMVVAIEPVGAADPEFEAGTYEVASTPSSTSLTLIWAGNNATSTTAYQSGARVASDPSRFPNGVYFSKAPLQNTPIQQPEAVPFVNYFFVGSPDRAILRIVSLQNYLFVFKETGIFVVSPTGNADVPYRVDPLDLTVNTYSPDSVQTVGGRIYALTNQGVVEVTSSGVRVVSDEIEDDLFQYFGPTLTQTDSLRRFTFGVSHETDRLYTLWVPPLNSNTDAPASAPYNKVRAYVYSTRAQAWTNWELERTCGLVRPYDDALLMGGGSALEPVVYKQRNTKTSGDFADESAELSVVSYANSVLTVGSTVGVAAGDAVVGDSTATVVSVDSNTELTVTNNPDATPTGETLSVDVNGVFVLFASGATTSLTAISLAAAINAAPALSGVVTASAVGSNVNMTAVTPGFAGNNIYITGNAYIGTQNYSTLHGGADAVAEEWYAGLEPFVGGDRGVKINATSFTSGDSDDTNAVAAITSSINSAPLYGVVATTTAGGLTLVATAATAGLAGSFVFESYFDTSVVTPIAFAANAVAAFGTFTVDSLPLSVTAYKAIPIDIEWRTVSGGAPANMRTSREVHLHSRLRQFYKATLAFASELVTTQVTQDVYPTREVDGTIPTYTPSTTTYPGRPVRPKKLRVGLPQDIARAAYFDFAFRINEAFALWTLNGFTLVDAAVSEKGQR